MNFERSQVMAITITAYLWNHALRVLCAGNKSELARQMNIRRTDINRMLKRLNEGCGSMRATEAVLEFMHREQVSLDETLADYVDGQSATDNMRLRCTEVACILREQMGAGYRAARAKMCLLKSAEDFMEQLEHALCSGYCCRRWDSVADCPCRKFSEYVGWVQEKIDENEAVTAI